MNFFDDWVDNALSAFVTQVFNSTEVTTGVGSSSVYPEGTNPNFINKTLMTSIFTGSSFGDELMERIVNSSYPAFKKKFSPSDLKGYVSNFTADFPKFMDANLPTSLIDFPHGPAKSYIGFDAYMGLLVPPRRDTLQFEPWFYAYMWDTYRYCCLYNNLYDKTYEKGVWVGLRQVDVHVPGEAADYRTDFFEEKVRPSRHVDTGDTSNRRNLTTVHYHPPTTTTTPGTTEPYTPPSLLTPVVLEGAYSAPPLTEPVVLSGGNSTGETVTTTTTIEPYMVITYEWRPGGHRSTNPLESESVTVPIPSWVLETTATYWQVNYTLDMYWSGDAYQNLIGPGDDRGYASKSIFPYWIYKDGSGVYPAWDAYAGNPNDEILGSIDEQYINSIPAANYYDSGSDSYKFVDPETSPSSYTVWESNAKKYGLQPVEILDQLKGSVDLTDNHRSAFELGVSLTTQDPVLVSYLRRLFNHWYLQSLNVPLSLFNNPERATMFSFSTLYVRRVFYFSGISKETKSGVFQAGAHKGQSSKTLSSFNETFTDDLRGTTFTGSWQGLKFFYQVTDNTYEVLRVGYPLCVYASARREKFGVEPTDERFILPVHLDLARQMGGVNFDYLVYKAARFTQVIAVVRKISFMESAFFQDTMKYIQYGMLITSAVGGVQGLMVNFGLNFVTAVVVYAAVNYGVQEAIKIVVKELGTDAALAIAFAMAAAGAAAGVSGNVFMDGLVDSTLLLQTASGLVTAVNENRMEKVDKGYQQLQYEQEEFGEFYAEQIKEIEEARELLNQPNYVSPYLFIGKVPMQVWGEGAQSFYERTIHSGNIGTKAFDFVHNYVEQKLRLPTIEDSAGEHLYGS